MRQMDQLHVVRHRVLAEGRSIRAACVRIESNRERGHKRVSTPARGAPRAGGMDFAGRMSYDSYSTRNDPWRRDPAPWTSRN